jgi:hypothetical protein
VIRLFTALLIVRAALCPTRASELVLTGISASGGTVRAFFSAAGGASTFSLRLHEEVAGVRFERINRRAQQVWIVESGEGRWLGLGRPGEQFATATSSASGVGAGGGSRAERSGSSALGASGGFAPGSRVTEGTALPAAVDPMEAGSPGAGQSDASPEAPHRWKPGVVRDPTAAELHRARYGAAALEAAVRNGQLSRD